MISFGNQRNAATVMWQDICSKIEKEASIAELATSALTGFMFENYDLILAQDIKNPQMQVKELLDWTLSSKQKRYNEFSTHVMACIWFHYYRGIEQNLL